MLRDGADPRSHAVVLSHRRSKRRLSDFDATGSTIAPGRWNTSGSPMIYTSEHFSTALLEKLVHGSGRLPPNQHYHLFGSQMAERAGGSYSQLAFGEINAKAVAAPLIPAGHRRRRARGAFRHCTRPLGKRGKAGAQRMSRKEQFPARPPADRRRIPGGQCRLLQADDDALRPAA